MPTDSDGVAALRFLSDNVAGRSGFRASFEVLEQACVTDEDCGPGFCEAGDCRCPEGYVGVRCQSDHCLADSGTHEGPYVARSQAAGLLADPETTCRWHLEPGRSDAAGARLRVTLRDSSIRSMGDVEGDDTRPDLSGDSSGARLSLSAAAERIASSLSGGYQEYKE